MFETKYNLWELDIKLNNNRSPLYNYVFFKRKKHLKKKDSPTNMSQNLVMKDIYAPAPHLKK